MISIMLKKNSILFRINGSPQIEWHGTLLELLNVAIIIREYRRYNRVG